MHCFFFEEEIKKADKIQCCLGRILCVCLDLVVFLSCRILVHRRQSASHKNAEEPWCGGHLQHRFALWGGFIPPQAFLVNMVELEADLESRLIT